MEDVRQTREGTKDGTVRRLRVMHVVTALDFGGVESHMKIVAESADRLQHSHVFCAIGAGGHVEKDMLAAGASVTCLNADPRSPSPSAFAGLLRHMRAGPVDVVHTHGAEANFHGLPAARLLGIPIRIGEEIGIPTHGWRARKAFRFAYGCAHRVIAISEAVAARISELGEAPRSKIDVVYPPVALPEIGRRDRHDRHESNRESVTLAFVGRLHPVKNPGILLRVLKELRDATLPARLWYIGDGPERPALAREAERLGVREQVSFCGFLGDVPDALRRADIFVLPSLSEGLGLAIIEAMAIGLPVVVTRNGAAPEYVQHGVTGYLIDPTDSRDIANAVKACWSLGEEARRRMGLRARDSVKDRFDRNTALRNMESVYNQLARGKIRE